jgi:hypothetical protein
MSAAHRRPDELRPEDAETEGSRPAPEAGAAATGAGTPFDWQVMLLRYLPQPAGSTHVIKRLAPR